MAQLDLHIGVHKTPTSFLQGVFQSNQPRLAEHGINIPHHRETRKFVTVPSQRKAYERLGQDWNTKYTDAELDNIISSFMLAARDGDVITFSASMTCKDAPQTVHWQGTIKGDEISGTAHWIVNRFYWTVQRHATYAGAREIEAATASQ